MQPRALVVALALACAPMPALACENAVLIELDDLVARVDRADRALLSGTTRDAMRDASFVLRVLRGDAAHYELRDASERRQRTLRARAEAVLALAVVRRDGRVDRRRWVPTSEITEATRSENVAWAFGVLARRADASPAGQARFAEALARYPHRRVEARTILMALADGDLMPDAWGYRVLAELSDEAGDRDRRDRAVNACQARAGELRDQICPRLVLAAR